MRNRTGEKVGWVGGWMGGFVWVCILSIVFCVQGKVAQGLLGLVLTAVAMVAIVFLAPWRFPLTPYWKLMLAPYGMLFASGAWAIWSFGGLGSAGLTWWNLFWLVPLLLPFGSLHNRKWTDGGMQGNASADADKPHA